MKKNFVFSVNEVIIGYKDLGKDSYICGYFCDIYKNWERFFI